MKVELLPLIIITAAYLALFAASLMKIFMER